MNNSKWCLRSCLIKCKKSETVWKVEIIQMSWTYQRTPKPLSTPPPHHPPTSILFKINWEMEILSKWDISRPNQISIIHIEAIFDPPRWSYIKIYNDFFFFSEQFSSFSFSVAVSINRNSRGGRPHSAVLHFYIFHDLYLQRLGQISEDLYQTNWA